MAGIRSSGRGRPPAGARGGAPRASGSQGPRPRGPSRPRRAGRSAPAGGQLDALAGHVGDLALEVVLAPAAELVDAERDGVVLVQDEPAAGAERRGDAVRPRVEIAQLRRRSGAGIGEVEAAAPELERELLRVGVDGCDPGRRVVRARSAPRSERRRRYERAEARELPRRVRRAGGEVEDVAPVRVGRRSATTGGAAAPRGSGGVAAALALLPGAAVVLGRLHRVA